MKNSTPDVLEIALVEWASVCKSVEFHLANQECLSDSYFQSFDLFSEYDDGEEESFTKTKGKDYRTNLILDFDSDRLYYIDAKTKEKSELKVFFRERVQNVPFNQNLRFILKK